MEDIDKKGKVIKRLKNRYQLVLMNEKTYEQKLTFMLTPLNLLVAFVSIFLIIALITWCMIVYTPLKEVIPGYGSSDTRENALIAVQKVDSLEPLAVSNAAYLKRLRAILKGEDIVDERTSLVQDTTVASSVEKEDYVISERDSSFRASIEEEDAYSINSGVADEDESNLFKMFFFPPLRGEITGEFEPEKSHFGIDISAPKNEAVKSILNGTVISAGWTDETGYVIQVQHPNNLISVYKHNSVLLKKVGDNISAGDPIAIIGNSGELSSGPHLHVEIWFEGQAINPKEVLILDE